MSHRDSLLEEEAARRRGSGKNGRSNSSDIKDGGLNGALVKLENNIKRKRKCKSEQRKNFSGVNSPDDDDEEEDAREAENGVCQHHDQNTANLNQQRRRRRQRRGGRDRVDDRLEVDGQFLDIVENDDDDVKRRLSAIVNDGDLGETSTLSGGEYSLELTDNFLKKVGSFGEHNGGIPELVSERDFDDKHV